MTQPHRVKVLKEMLRETRSRLEDPRLFDPKTVKKVMKILEADIWARYWTGKLEELLNESNK